MIEFGTAKLGLRALVFNDDVSASICPLTITDTQTRLRVVSYLDAALNKIEVAGYCQERLAALLQSGEARRVEVQTYFETLLYAGVAATDQVAEAGNQALSLGLEKPNLRGLLTDLRSKQLEAGLAACADALDAWQRSETVREARKIRRRATHHYYPKSRRDGAWFYEASDGAGVEETDSVGLLAEAYVCDLKELGGLVWEFATALGAADALREKQGARPT